MYINFKFCYKMEKSKSNVTNAKFAMFWRSREEMRCQKVLKWKEQWRREELKVKQRPHTQSHVSTGQLTTKCSSRVYVNIFHVPLTVLIHHCCVALCHIVLFHFLPRWKNLSSIALIWRRLIICFQIPMPFNRGHKSSPLTPLS